MGKGGFKNSEMLPTSFMDSPLAVVIQIKLNTFSGLNKSYLLR